MVNKQLYQLIEYARRTPHFAQLQREDQITLLRAGWNELLIATVAWRSIEVCVPFDRHIQQSQSSFNIFLNSRRSFSTRSEQMRTVQLTDEHR